MIIIKFIILLTIFGASTSIGVLMSKKFKNRVIELREFKNAINTLETKIKFTYEPIAEIFSEISNNLQHNISQVFNMTGKYLDDNTTKDAWNKAIDETKISLNLNDEDINIIRNLGNLLGKTDVEGQISEIKVTSRYIDTQIIKAEEERKKNEKMYRNLGTIVGLAIVIILI